jgi:hypothetical protein
VTAKEVLAGVLRNEGADVAAHEVIRHEQTRPKVWSVSRPST